MIFSEVFVAIDIKKKIIRSLKTGSFPQTILFSEKGTYGALATAITVAQYLVCDSSEDEPCNDCHQCFQANHFMHPDIHYSFPTLSVSKNDNYAKYSELWIKQLSNDFYFSPTDWNNTLNDKNRQMLIHAEETRRIIEHMSYKSYESKNKVCILWLPEYLAKNANILLKIIEEPYPNTYFIFVTRSYSDVLPTLRSRFMQISFPNLEKDTLTRYVNKYSKHDDEIDFDDFQGDIELFRRMADKDSLVQQRFEKTAEWFRLIYKKDLVGVLDIVEEIAKWDREKVKQFVHYLLELLRQCLYVQNQTDRLVYFKGEEQKFVYNFSSSLSSSKIEELIRILDESFTHLQRNANIKVLFLDVSLSFIKVFKPKYLGMKK